MLGSDLLHRNKAERAYRMFSVKTAVKLNFSWTTGNKTQQQETPTGVPWSPACSLPLVHNSHRNKM